MKKIMFNDEYGLTRAVLKGRKTMTRRAVKFPTKFDWGFYHYPLKPVTQEGYRAFVELLDEDEFPFNPERYVSSQYAVGEIVAIAQSYKTLEKEIDRLGLPLNLKPEIYKMAGYKNKMFVKGDDMPHHIQITSIRVEHLQDISDEESLKEGIWDSWPFPNSKNKPENCYACYVNCRSTDYRDWFNTPRDAFAALIDKVSGEGTWESDPLVWVYEFKLID